MMRRTPCSPVTTVLATCSVALLALFPLAPAEAEDPSSEQKDEVVLEKEIQQATRRATDTQYLLQYRFQQGESMKMKVVQLVSMQTRIDGNDQNVQSRSVSTRRWDVKDVDEDGNVTFTHTIMHVSMWQKVTGKDEIRYDSETDEKAPETYRAIAEKLGKPISTITMTREGKLLQRKNQARQFDAGIDSLAIPLPGKAIQLGYRWYTPEKLRIRTETGTYRTVQLRRQYRLDKVQAGVATISISTQVLTPLDDPRVKSQIVQRIQDGSIRFDIERGRILSRQLDLDQRVIGFNGPTSLMHYLARTREEVVKDGGLQ